MKPYLLAIDNGSQSTKVTIFDARGRAVASASRRLKPYDISVPGHAVHPDDDIWESIAGACLTSWPASPATRRHRRGGPVHHPVLPGPAGRGRQPGRAGTELDGRAGPRPYEADNPQARYVTTSSGYITHRLTGQFTDTAANYEGVWPIDHDTAAWSDDPAAYAATGMPRDMLFDLVPRAADWAR